MPRNKRLLVTVIAAWMLPTIALGAWSIVTNPVTSNPEATWSNKPPGQSTSDILYSYLDGSSWAPSVTITHDGANTSSPAITIDGSGNRSLAWESSDSTARILLSTLPSSGGSWSSFTTLSDAAESSRAPSIAVFGTDIWVGYEVVPSSGSRIVKVAKSETGGAVDRSVVRSTSSTDALKVKIHSEGGHLWMEWVDSTGVMGWSEYLSGSWSDYQVMYYDLESDIPATRDAIRDTVLGG